MAQSAVGELRAMVEHVMEEGGLCRGTGNVRACTVRGFDFADATQDTRRDLVAGSRVAQCRRFQGSSRNRPIRSRAQTCHPFMDSKALGICWAE